MHVKSSSYQLHCIRWMTNLRKPSKELHRIAIQGHVASLQKTDHEFRKRAQHPEFKTSTCKRYPVVTLHAQPETRALGTAFNHDVPIHHQLEHIRTAPTFGAGAHALGYCIMPLQGPTQKEVGSAGSHTHSHLEVFQGLML